MSAESDQKEFHAQARRRLRQAADAQLRQLTVLGALRRQSGNEPEGRSALEVLEFISTVALMLGRAAALDDLSYTLITRYGDIKGALDETSGDVCRVIKFFEGERQRLLDRLDMLDRQEG